MRLRTWGTIFFVIAAALPGVTAPTGAQTGPSVVVPGTIVGTAVANVRACARADCPVAGTVRLGDAVTVSGESEAGFVPIAWNGEIGYVFGLYVATPDGTPELLHGQVGCNRVALIVNIGVGYPLQIDAFRWLAAEGIPATVFPMGWWAEENAAALQEIARLGFPVGSHGQERLELTGRSDAEVIADIRAADAAIEAVIGEAPEPYFTAYAAATDERVRRLVAAEGYLPVNFDVPAGDWDFGVTADEVFARVVPNVADGDIVELHLDAPASAESTAVALPWIVEQLRNKGFEFVTISDLAAPCASAADDG